MVRFLFWNYRYELPDREQILVRLVQHESVDVIVLAESSCEPIRLIELLSSTGRHYHPMPLLHKRFQILAGYPAGVFRQPRDHDRLCLLNLHLPGHPEIILGAVHLVSGVHYADRSVRLTKAAPLARAIRELQIERNHARTIIVGDFNLNPFDDGMIFPESFGAMMTKSLVKKIALLKNDRFSRFYNPIWARLGREIYDGPPGTYYWNQHLETNIYWNYLDQVLVGHDLLDFFPDSRFRILTSVPGTDGPLQLIRATGHHWAVEVSDHLPLIFDVDLPPEADDD